MTRRTDSDAPRGGASLSQDGAARTAAQITEVVRSTGLLDVQGDGPLLLLCSAGRDSRALLRLATEIVGAPRLAVLHVDHGLRPGASDDAFAITAACEELGVAVEVRRAGKRPATGNLHAWARAQRQRLASAEMDRLGASLLATAHTRTDLVETALGRLASQPGRRALLSMRARQGQLVRPLLGISREETGAYCRAHGITWRDDPSNDDERYARARLRHGVIPVLRSINPRAEEAIVRTLAELAEESEALDALVAAELRPPADGDAGPSITAVALADLPRPIARLALRTLCESTIGGPVPQASSRIDDVLALTEPATRTGVAALDLGSGARIELRGGVLRCRPSKGPAAPTR